MSARAQGAAPLPLRLVLPLFAVACAGCVSTGRLAPVSCTGPGAPTVDVLPADEADVPPALVGGLEAFHRRLVVSDTARRRSASASAVVRFVVGADGSVVCSDAVQGENEFFNDAVRRAVHASAFEPARHDGRPVAVVMQMPASYR